MTKNDDGSILLNKFDVLDLDFLIARTNENVRQSNIFTSQPATIFAKKWQEIRKIAV